MKGILSKLSRPGMIIATALLFVLGIVAWAYWIGAAAAP